MRRGPVRRPQLTHGRLKGARERKAARVQRLCRSHQVHQSRRFLEVGGSDGFEVGGRRLAAKPAVVLLQDLLESEEIEGAVRERVLEKQNCSYGTRILRTCIRILHFRQACATANSRL